MQRKEGLGIGLQRGYRESQEAARLVKDGSRKGKVREVRKARREQKNAVKG